MIYIYIKHLPGIGEIQVADTGNYYNNRQNGWDAYAYQQPSKYSPFFRLFCLLFRWYWDSMTSINASSRQIMSCNFRVYVHVLQEFSCWISVPSAKRNWRQEFQFIGEGLWNVMCRMILMTLTCWIIFTVKALISETFWNVRSPYLIATCEISFCANELVIVWAWCNVQRRIEINLPQAHHVHCLSKWAPLH